jgi:hypothetical protein
VSPTRVVVVGLPGELLAGESLEVEDVDRFHTLIVTGRVSALRQGQA